MQGSVVWGRLEDLGIFNHAFFGIVWGFHT